MTSISDENSVTKEKESNILPNESSLEEEEDENRIFQVQQTKENVLTLFSNANSQWSEYYSIGILEKESEERQKNAKPLLSSQLKVKLAKRKAKMRAQQLVKKQESTDTTVTSSTVSTPAVDVNNPVKAVEQEVTVEKQVVIEAEMSEEDAYSELESDSEEEEEDEENDILQNQSEELDSDTEQNGAIAGESKEKGTVADETKENGIADKNVGFNGEEFVAISDGPAPCCTTPWITKEYKGPKALRLHEEIINFYNFFKETEEERAQREIVLKQVEDICKEVDPYCRMEVFGSYPSHLMIPGSDLDIHVLSDLDPKKFLIKVYDKVRNKRIASKVERVFSARVPIVKFAEIKTGQHIDISCNSKASMQLAVNTVNNFVKTYPQFKYLVLLLKYFLRQRGLNEVFSGGLSSFGLSLMVVNHLQMHNCNFNTNDAQITTLGTLLLDFFALYGIYFNYRNVGIDARRGGLYVTNPNDARNNQLLQLYVIDPNDFTNNVAKGTVNVAGIRHAFQHAFHSLTAEEAEFTGESQSASLLSRIIRVTKEDMMRRVHIHHDISYKQYCLKNGIILEERKIRQRRGGKRDITGKNNNGNMDSRKDMKRRRRDDNQNGGVDSSRKKRK